MEQALAMTYATLRFVHLGWRVIRLEATPAPGDAQPGDPNRYVGGRVADADRHAYFVAPNVGKEAIALNLKTEAGRAALRRIVRELDVDVFCCNTIPSRYERLGIDHATLAAVKPDLIWAGISAMGPDHPDLPGYDPMIQSQTGYMEVTGQPDGPPTLMGVPLVDLKAGDEVYANVMLALAEQAEQRAAGQPVAGRRIDVSMFQAAASWLITLLPLIDMDCGPEEITRWGNAHRKFIPTNAYPTRDGYIYMALGSNAQWQRLTAIAKFAGIDRDGRRARPDARYAEREALYREIGAVTARHTTAEIAADFTAAKIPHSVINDIPAVHGLDEIVRKSTRTTLPDGSGIRMQPMAVDLEGASRDYGFAPRYGEHTLEVLREAGYSAAEAEALVAAGDAATRHDQAARPAE